MKVLIATNFLKGSLSAIEAAQAVKSGIDLIDSPVQSELIPIADGGDGTLDSVHYSTVAKEYTATVKGPMANLVHAKWLMLEDGETAVIEAAQANGLSLLIPEQYNPLITTSYGVGELIKRALEYNCQKIYIGIGGSATNDAGIGLLQALGVKFFDNNVKEIGFGGGTLKNIVNIDVSGLNARIKNTKIFVACDVNNPLCGENGASKIYAPQKGASPKDVEVLDENLSHFADITAKALGVDHRNAEGAGAAGGIGFALKAFLNAELISGFRFIAGLTGLEEKIKHSDLVITTEGRLDTQTLSGKAPFMLAQLAKKHNIPLIILAGSVERNLDFNGVGITAVFSIVDGIITLDDAINNAYYLLENTTKQIFKTLKSVKI